MRFTQRIRHFWHGFYYGLVSRRGQEFAMRCRDITHQVDSGLLPKGAKAKVRFWLHLSLCQACKNYFEFSQFLVSQLRKMADATSQNDIEILNQKMVQKFKDPEL